MKEQHINIEVTARYYTLGELNNAPDQEVWVVLHGYGQLAKYFIKKFEAVAKSGGFVVAPEGLSLFYLKGTEGRVGATWMTKDFRKQAIENYTHYLQEVYLALNLHHKHLVLFSFSQGGATLIRWVVKHQTQFKKMIVWAGGFPADVDQQACQKAFRDKSLFYVYGDEDQYITPERMDEQRKLFRQFCFHPKIIRFAGKHVMDINTLQRLL